MHCHGLSGIYTGVSNPLRYGNFASSSVNYLSPRSGIHPGYTNSWVNGPWSPHSKRNFSCHRGASVINAR